MALKYGRRAPSNGPALRLGKYLTGTVPAHPAAADYLAAMNGNWQMLGNDSYGDCVAVTWANVRRLMTTALTDTPNYPDYGQVIEVYKTQNPDFPYQDNGMDIQTLLKYLVSTGGPDGVKALGYAKVDHNNADEVKAAIAIFGYVWTGINVQVHNQQEFEAGQPWTWESKDQVEGGHSIITGGYGTEASVVGRPSGSPIFDLLAARADLGSALSGDEKFITWAAETSFTDEFWSSGVEEAWVVIWPEHLGTREFLEGMNVAALAADYEAVTGSNWPGPVPAGPTPLPAPEPSPDPIPDPIPAIEGFWHKVWTWLKRVI